MYVSQQRGTFKSLSVAGHRGLGKVLIIKNREVTMPRIGHNLAAFATAVTAQSSQQAVSQSINKLSSGLRITKASDGAAELSVSSGFEKDIRGAEQANRNTQQGIVLGEIVDKNLELILDDLNKMRDIAYNISATPDQFMDAGPRNAGKAQFDHLMDDIDLIISRTNWNNDNLLDDSSKWGVTQGGGNIQVGSSDAASDSFTMSFADFTTANFDGGEIRNGQAAGPDAYNGYGVNWANKAEAANAVVVVDSYIDAFFSERANVRGMIHQLETAQTMNDMDIIHKSDAQQSIIGVDMAMESARFAQASARMQASNAMMSQANTLPFNVLNMLPGA
jgi:flagellin